MNIKIIKCSEPKGWYANKIGEEFKVIREHKIYTGEEVYVIDEGRIVISFVHKDDCEIVKE